MARRALHLMEQRLAEQEQQAARDYAAARQQLDQFKTQLNNLEDYRRGYLKQALAKGKDGTTADGFHQYQLFIQKLELAGQQQMKTVFQMEQNLNKAHQNWIELQTKRKAMLHLIEQDRHREVIRQDKIEQKQLDEYAQMAFQRRLSEV
ncbi:flagellar export protein FliJ [Alginatibacterium sediminis]|uniref:Flagellar FliJ protein n=1 Tax=Alginatibacterium sediminis TaxID=2164068 RepID=A0A420EFQ3_9ALTE|nr:flagellar export protein FliJ [Alginatibacterium sediminis]RKF19484.1 flagellar export protein FliJ [Alginatibacterium sediminis]